MAYPRNLLNTEEELILDLKPHWLWIFAPSATAAVVILIAILGLVWWSPDGTGGSIVTVILVGAVIGSLVWFGWSWLKWTTTMFVLTTDRLITRSGIVAKQGIEIPLERINTVKFSQSVLERIVGAGDLAIESAGEQGMLRLHDIRKPSIVQKEIYVQIEANENRKYDRMRGPGPGPGPGAGSGDATTVQSSGASIPQQIDQLAELHQRGVLSDSEYHQKKAELLDRM